MAGSGRFSHIYGATQAISGLYCAAFATWAYFHPYAPSVQPAKDISVGSERLGMPTALFLGLVVLGISVALPPIVGWINRLRGNQDTMDSSLAPEKLEHAIENILQRRGILPGPPEILAATSEPAAEGSSPKNAMLDGELYRIVTAPKGAFAEMTRQIVESMREEFAIDVDILVELYVVNLSAETQYIRDFCASVEIDGERIEMCRQRDFHAWDVNGTDYEYCLDPDPAGTAFDLEHRAETLIPIFSSLPVELNPRKPLEGWVRFLLKEVDPKKLENNRTYAFRILDSLGEEHPIIRSRKLETTSRISVHKKGVHR